MMAGPELSIKQSVKAPPPPPTCAHGGLAICDALPCRRHHRMRPHTVVAAVHTPADAAVCATSTVGLAGA